MKRDREVEEHKQKLLEERHDALIEGAGKLEQSTKEQAKRLRNGTAESGKEFQVGRTGKPGTN